MLFFLFTIVSLDVQLSLSPLSLFLSLYHSMDSGHTYIMLLNFLLHHLFFSILLLVLYIYFVLQVLINKVVVFLTIYYYMRWKSIELFNDHLHTAVSSTIANVLTKDQLLFMNQQFQCLLHVLNTQKAVCTKDANRG